MKSTNVQNESSKNNTNTENNVNNSKGTTSTRLQNLAGKIDESKGNETQTPNPKKAPLNYIENMGEWEETQKNYMKEISQKQQEISAILGAYEDKAEETDRFKTAKSELEIELEKTMGKIIDKLQKYEDFLTHIYTKIYENMLDITNTNEIKETTDKDKETENNNNKEIEEKTETLEIEIGDEESVEYNEEDNEEDNEKDNEENIIDILKDFGIEIKVIPQDTLGDGILLDNTKEEINRFLSIKQNENREKYQKLLNNKEIEGIENLYNTIKKYCEKYQELICQIDLIEAKIEKLENEENILYTNYNNGTKEVKEMEENMENLNETYFLNSYLSTQNASIDNFVSSPLVEKQIANIIELNKMGRPIPKTILLYGRLNLGKTYAANVLATELGRKMYHIKSYDIFTGGFSDPNAMLDAIFTGAIKKKEPCIIFLDEIENFSSGYDGSPYQNLLENTIRHHISKIKDSSLDIIIIGAISDKNKLNPNLLKQDVFSKQIYFNQLSKEKYEELFHKMLSQKNIILGSDIDIHKMFDKKLNENELDQEYLKKLINMAIDFHLLNNPGESERITLTSKDFNDSIEYMGQYKHNFSQNLGYSHN